MLVLIIVVSIGLIFLGYRFAIQVDTFTGADLLPANTQQSETAVLLFGPTALLTDLELTLRESNIDHLEIYEPAIPAGLAFRALVALSECEMDNILLCHEARHLFPGVFTIARCKDPIYRWLFEQEGIDRILLYDPSVELILNNMKSWIQQWPS